MISAANAGLDLATVAEIIAKWGPDVLQLIIDGLRYGLTKDFLLQILEVLGKNFLKQAVLAARQSQMKKAVRRAVTCCPEEAEAAFEDCCPELKVPVSTFAEPLPIIEGEQVDSLEGNSPFIDLILKLLPQLLANPAILEAIVKALLELFTKKASAVARVLAD
jgi:hypothetical protein